MDSFAALVGSIAFGLVALAVFVRVWQSAQGASD